MRLLIILSILSQCFQTIEQSVIKLEFTMTIQNKSISDLSSYSGNIVIHGDCFILSLMENEIAYDGKSLFVYNRNDEEITISTPDESDLLDINPFLYAKYVSTNAQITEQFIKESNQQQIILLPTEHENSVEKIKLFFDIDNEITLPQRIEMIERKQQTIITINQKEKLPSTPKFVLEKDNVHINDIR